MTYAAQYELQPANYKLALLVTLQQSIAQSPLYSWYWIDTLMGLGAYVRAYIYPSCLYSNYVAYLPAVWIRAHLERPCALDFCLFSVQRDSVRRPSGRVAARAMGTAIQPLLP